MLNYILTKENLFQSYNTEHISVIIISIITCLLVIWIGNRFLTEKQKPILGTFLALITTFFVLFRMYMFYYIGEFNMQEDLPLFLCRLIPFIIPFTMWYRHQYSFGILYFWVLAGTMNAVVTPDLEYGMPHFDTMASWFIHCGLIITVLYGVFVYKLRPYPVDFKRSVVAGVFYVIGVHLCNMLLGANYAYTMNKPPNGSIMDILGPWPIYLFSLFFVAILLFVLLYIPFFIKDRKSKQV